MALAREGYGSMESRDTPDRWTLVAFVGAVFIGGNNFLAVKLSNEELDPVFGATLRFGAAMIILLVLSRLRGWPLPRGRAALGAALYGLFGFGISYSCLYFALVELTPGLSSVIVASVPILTLGLAVLHGQERFTRSGIIGGVLAVAGIATLSARSLGGEIKPIYFFAALAGAASIAESTVIVKTMPRAHPFTTNAVGMVAGTAFLAIASLIFGEQWAVPQRAQTWVVLTWLVLAGSIGLFSLYLYVVSRWSASASNYVVALMPIVAVTTGVLFADDELSVELVVGGILVMVAVYIGALSRERTVEARPSETVPEPATHG